MDLDSKNVIKEIKQFRAFLKYGWPTLRLLVKGKLSKRCSTCFLSENFISLVDGVCELCHNYKPEKQVTHHTKDLERKLDERFTNAQNLGKKNHDAIILFSGGKDSSLLIHKLKEDYPKLRILALSIDNNFMSPIAKKNIKEIISKLDVDHMFFRPSISFTKKMFRYAFTHLNEKGCSGTVDFFDGNLFLDISRNIAAQMEIPLIICGLSHEQIDRHTGINYFETKNILESNVGVKESKRTDIGGIQIKDIFEKDELGLWWDPSKYDKKNIPTMVYPYYVWNFSEEYIKSKVIELGLVELGNQDPLLTNSSLIPLMGIVDVCNYGYSSFEEEFAKNVREGKSDRKNWLYTFELLEFSAKTGFFVSKSVDDTLKKLDLTKENLGIKK
jgi:hypothetical protein